MLLVSFLLLGGFAVAIGWHFGQKKSAHQLTSLFNKNPLPADYYLGLQYLVNEQPDQAVDTFIKMLEVTEDTFETHLVLGSLFRRRGEVDRAIRIHQNLLARPQLNKTQRIQALSELAEDYLRAGVLDRAERLFLELIAIDENLVSSLHHLLHIYQQEKDWQNAIIMAKKIDEKGARPMQIIIAHYYCELAMVAREKKQIEQARQQIKMALTIDSNCVRACLLLAELEMLAGNFKAAIRNYKRVQQQDPEFISEMIVPLSQCYEQLNLAEELIEYLQKCLYQYPRISIALLLAAHLRKNQGDRVAIEFMVNQIRQYPSLRGLQQLAALYCENSQGDTREKLLLLHHLITELLAKRPIYRCVQCGFSVNTLYWQCPQCREWNTVKPVHGLEGD